jgi:hypothetical protein
MNFSIRQFLHEESVLEEKAEINIEVVICAEF